MTGPARFHAIIRGRVQGVAFRAFAEQRAQAYGAAGYVQNLGNGDVEVVAEGDRALLDEFLADLKRGPVGARVREVVVNWEGLRAEFSEFSIRFGW